MTHGPAAMCLSPTCTTCRPTRGEGCRVCGATDTATVDLFSGRRCTAHPPTFDPHVATRIALAGWPSTATAYRNFWTVSGMEHDERFAS